MKRKIRTVTVGQQRFAWQCQFAGNAIVLTLSPLDDRTAAVHVRFADDRLTAVPEAALGSYPSVLTAEKDGQPHEWKVISPRMAALLADCLTGRFLSRQTAECDGFALLRDAGCRITTIKYGWYW